MPLSSFNFIHDFTSLSSASQARWNSAAYEYLTMSLKWAQYFLSMYTNDYFLVAQASSHKLSTMTKKIKNHTSVNPGSMDAYINTPRISRAKLQTVGGVLWYWENVRVACLHNSHNWHLIFCRSKYFPRLVFGEMWWRPIAFFVDAKQAFSGGHRIMAQHGCRCLSHQHADEDRKEQRQGKEQRACYWHLRRTILFTNMSYQIWVHPILFTVFNPTNFSCAIVLPGKLALEWDMNSLRTHPVHWF